MDDFHRWAREAGNLACEEWGYPPVADDWCERVGRRLPAGLRAVFSAGVASGVIELVGGHRFTLSGLPPAKGPYALFSRSEKERPAPNWEYFVQAVEFLRVRRAVGDRGLRVDFEDDLMDISVYDADRVLWCIEVKEKASQLGPLLSGVRANAPSVDLQRPDRGNDALRKAKYIIRHRPLYFSLVAVGARLDFSVAYHDGGFGLSEDIIPYG